MIAKSLQEWKAISLIFREVFNSSLIKKEKDLKTLKEERRAK